MDILKQSVSWAEGEVLSAKLTLLYSLLIFIAAIGFWQLGKTQLAKALVVPMFVTGFLIVTIGIGLFYANHKRVTGFRTEYENSPATFIQKEKLRTETSMNAYKGVFRFVPALIIAAALLLIFFPAPVCRAIGIAVILLCVSVLVIDGNGDARNTAYHNLILSEIGK